MRLIIVGICCLFLATACKNTDQGSSNSDTDLITNTNGWNGDPDKAPRFQFEDDVFEFGQISQGEEVSTTFVFTNVGRSPLIIQDVKVTCGCTVIDTWPKEAIVPGGRGEIEVHFNSEGKKGAINKKVSIIANTAPTATTVVTLSGEVLVPNND